MWTLSPAATSVYVIYEQIKFDKVTKYESQHFIDKQYDIINYYVIVILFDKNCIYT